MKNYENWNENICPFSLMYLLRTNLILVFILTTTKYNYIGFLIGIDTHLNILFGKSIYSYSSDNFIYIKNYDCLYLNSDKIISITPLNIY
jgi:hypothetical protein